MLCFQFDSFCTDDKPYINQFQAVKHANSESWRLDDADVLQMLNILWSWFGNVMTPSGSMGFLNCRVNCHMISPEWLLLKQGCDQVRMFLQQPRTRMVSFPSDLPINPCQVGFSWEHTTVYPKKYAHGFCFAVLCCGYTLTDFPISIRLTSLALWQSYDCPSASKATLMDMDKYFIWIHYERLHNHNKAKHNKTVCIFLGIYCMYLKFTLCQNTEMYINIPILAPGGYGGS